MHEFVIAREGNYQTGLRGYDDIKIWKNQFTSRKVVIKISESCVIPLWRVIRHPLPILSSLIVRMRDM